MDGVGYMNEQKVNINEIEYNIEDRINDLGPSEIKTYKKCQKIGERIRVKKKKYGEYLSPAEQNSIDNDIMMQHRLLRSIGLGDLIGSTELEENG